MRPKNGLQLWRVTSAGKHAGDAGPPRADELEVSLFGPGYGESLAVHLGESQWMIVDSCVDASGRPPSLAYLESLGVDCAADVAAVVATHWHDDHVRGLADVLEACERARFLCPVALSSKEFLKLTQANPAGADRTTSGVRELGRALDIARARKKRGRPQAGPVLVAENQVIYEGGQCDVRALSPSSAATETALRAIAELLPAELRPHLRVVPPKQNECSVALWLRGDAGSALLAADVERQTTDDRGWGAVVALAPARSGRASLVKVPHHGSETAHDARMWDELLSLEPSAMLTPWSLGGRSLPSRSDRERIAVLAPDARLVGNVGVKPKRYDGAVERTLKEAALSRETALGRMGHTRARCDPARPGEWRVEAVANSTLLSQATLPGPAATAA